MSAPASSFAGADRPTWELYSTCIHCGLCLQQCPTYRVLGTEMDSPRGRIYQVLLADEGRLAIGESFVTHIDRCLGCLACETACPSGVRYSAIVERARAQIEQHYQRWWPARALRGFFYLRLLTSERRLARWARRLRWYQRSGLRRLSRASGVLRLLGLADVERLAPEISARFTFEDLGRTFPAVGNRRARVAFLSGCVGSVAFDELNRATIRLLQENGVEVIVPEGQGCCGALHAHAGFREQAREQARRNLRALLGEGIDAIVTNSAGCGATMKEYGELLGEDAEHAQAARQFSAKARDVTEYLAELGMRSPKQLKLRATYQDPCHLAHAQKVRSAPRALLRAAGVELVEMSHPDYCCGSAGVYNVAQNALAMQILEAKMNDVAATEADVVITANTGCMLQLRAGVERRGLKLPVRHVVEVLNDAF